jgi:alginate O-acetyltransferase complex protein AlgI
MVLGGFWHGASWTFVAWGLYHGLLLVIHRAVPWPRWLGRPAVRPLCVLTTFLLVCVGWVFFRAQTFADAAAVLERMALPVAGLDLRPGLAALALFGVALTAVGHWLGTRVDVIRAERLVPAPVMGAALSTLCVLALLLLPPEGKVFIYFQF